MLANGPRLTAALNSAQESGINIFEMDAFALNYYLANENLVGIKPKYYVLMDPMFFKDKFTDDEISKEISAGKSFDELMKTLDRAKELRKNVLSSEMTCFMPARNSEYFCQYKNAHAINGRVGAFSSNYDDILKTLGWPSMTAYVSISFTIFIAGRRPHLNGIRQCLYVRANWA